MVVPAFRRSHAGVGLAYIAARVPCLPFGSSIEVQVPPWTNFHELPWKSTVEVPWQVVPGPAAQSFWPLRATPKHFSLCAAMAAAFSASVKGAAEASVASAPDRALARTSEVTTVFADIGLLRIAGWPSSGALGLRVRARERYVGRRRKMTRQPTASQRRRIESAREDAVGKCACEMPLGFGIDALRLCPPPQRPVLLHEIVVYRPLTSAPRRAAERLRTRPPTRSAGSPRGNASNPVLSGRLADAELHAGG